MIFLFNGPPGAGKDIACSHLRTKFPDTVHLQAKTILFKQTATFFDVSLEWFLKDYNSIKEIPQYSLDGFSRRQALIFVAEEVIKPRYGSNFLGQELAKQIDPTKDYVISDGGFYDEVLPIINKVGNSEFVLVQLTRKNCSFALDSRRWFNPKSVTEIILGDPTEPNKDEVLSQQLDLKTYRIHNNQSLEAFYDILTFIFDKEKNARKNRNQEDLLS